MKLLYSIKKELLEIYHDRTMLSVLIAFPIFIMLFLGSSFGSVEINGLPVGVVGPTNTTFSSGLISSLNQSNAFNLIGFHTENGAMESFRNGKLRAIIVIPFDIEENLSAGEGSKIRILVDNSDIALQEAILAAMGSVVQASSTGITRDYVVSAWEDLSKLNESATLLEQGIIESKAQMQNTKEDIRGIQEGIGNVGIGNLKQSLENTADQIDDLEGIVSEGGFVNESSEFLDNAEYALNESIITVAQTYDELILQEEDLNSTIEDLDASIAAIGLIRNTSNDSIINGALDANIIALISLKNSTIAQRDSLVEQRDELSDLNSTLLEFEVQLGDFSSELEVAETMQEERIDEFRSKVGNLGLSLQNASGSIDEMESLFMQINSTTMEIDNALTSVVEQIDSVEELILSLKETVNEQTAKDPERIALPLEVSVEGQYQRESFVDFIIPQVIGVSLLFSCFLLASISLVREKTRKTIVRLRLIPGAFRNSIAAKILTITIISLLQVAIILFVGFGLFSVELPSDVFMLVVGTIISALVLSSIGIILGFIARTESAAIQSSLLIAIPMLFLGNIIFSPDLLPSYTQLLLEFLPLSHITTIFKIVLITSGDPTTNIIALLSYFAALAIIIAAIVYRTR